MTRMSKITPNDLLILKILSIHQEIQPFNFLKYIILVEYERKNEFSGNNATYSLYNMGCIEHPYRYNLFTLLDRH